MYVRTYVCTHVRIYICTYVRKYVCTYVRTYVCRHVCMDVYIFAFAEIVLVVGDDFSFSNKPTARFLCQCRGSCRHEGSSKRSILIIRALFHWRPGAMPIANRGVSRAWREILVNTHADTETHMQILALRCTHTDIKCICTRTCIHTWH
jgi:hypothetical protein